MLQAEKTWPVLQGDRIYLRQLTAADVNEQYCRWLNDPEVNQYLECRFQTATLESMREFVHAVARSTANCLFGIRLAVSHRHIGNVKLGPIDKFQRRSELGVLIGEKDCWGKGYATEAINLVVNFAFKELKLHKLTAGCYAVNTGSIALFRKCGFQLDGIRARHCLYKDAFVDAILFGLINPAEENASFTD